MKHATDIVLVSGSPRRRELLTMIGVTFEVLVADIDESRMPDEDITPFVTRLAREKAHAGIGPVGDDRPRLGADTIVVVDGQILGKPRSREEAAEMLTLLSDNEHQVYTAVAVAIGEEQLYQALNVTRVEFGAIPAAWIERYCLGDEPMDKAGAYAIQGLAGQWVKRVEGSYSGVMGLPLFETSELLRNAGVPSKAGVL